MIYCDDFYCLNIKTLKERGIDAIDISNPNDTTFIQNVVSGDYLLIDMHRYDSIIELLNGSLNITFVLFLNQESTNPGKRKSILDSAPPNYKIYFSTAHLDLETHNNDLSFTTRLRTFTNLFKSKFYDINYLSNLIDKKRAKKYNMFNRAPNLRRLKAFELIKKRSIKLEDCYYTFGFVLLKNVFSGINNLLEYFEHTNNQRRNMNDGLEFDWDLILSSQNEFKTYEDRELMRNDDRSVGIDNTYEIINNHSLDSYISFVIESSNDTCNDLRITEKTVRPLLLKNIFLSIGCNSFANCLNKLGIETFEEVFGLEQGWDNNCSETEKIAKFVDALEYINNLSKEEIEKIYFSDNIQRKLNNNHKIVMEAFNNEAVVIDELKM